MDISEYPEEILCHILTFLNAKELLIIEMTCKKFGDIFSDEYWKKIFYDYCQELTTIKFEDKKIIFPKNVSSWKAHFKLNIRYINFLKKSNIYNIKIYYDKILQFETDYLDNDINKSANKAFEMYTSSNASYSTTKNLKLTYTFCIKEFTINKRLKSGHIFLYYSS